MKQNLNLPGTPEEFIEANMNLAHSVAWKCAWATHKGTLDMDDLFSVAYYGLIKAYQGFNPAASQGVNGEQIKFSTYAYPTITGYLMRHIRDFNSTIKIKQKDHDVLAKILQSGIPITENPEAISAELDISLAEVRNALLAMSAQSVESLDREFEVSEDSEGTISSLIGTCDEDICDKVAFDEFLSQLNPKLRDVYQYRVSIGLSQTETARIMGNSQPHIARLEKRLFEAAREYGQREMATA